MQEWVRKKAKKRLDGRLVVRATVWFDADVYDRLVQLVTEDKKRGRFINEVVRKSVDEILNEPAKRKAEPRVASKELKASAKPSNKKQKADSAKGALQKRAALSPPAPRSGRALPTSEAPSKRPEPAPSVAPRSRRSEARPSVSPTRLSTAPPRSRRR